MPVLTVGETIQHLVAAQPANKTIKSHKFQLPKIHQQKDQLGHTRVMQMH